MHIKITREVSFDENDVWFVSETISLIEKLSLNGFDFTHMLRELENLLQFIQEGDKESIDFEYPE